MLATGFELGAPLAILRVVTQHGTSAAIQKHACDILNCLALGIVEDQQVSLLKRLGAIERAVWAMDHFGESPEVLSSACCFIGNMIKGEDLAKKIVGAGALRATISAMKKNHSQYVVQDCGCFALRRLVRMTGDWGAVQVVVASGIDLIIAAMKNHTNAEDVLDEGCTVLAKLAELNLADHRRRIIDANGLEALGRVIRDYQDKQNRGPFKNATKAMRLLVPEP
jgi:hypothetical protein